MAALFGNGDDEMDADAGVRRLADELDIFSNSHGYLKFRLGLSIE